MQHPPTCTDSSFGSCCNYLLQLVTVTCCSKRGKSTAMWVNLCKWLQWNLQQWSCCITT